MVLVGLKICVVPPNHIHPGKLKVDIRSTAEDTTVPYRAWI